MLSVASMLNHADSPKTSQGRRSPALDISHILCQPDDPPINTPSLSPSMTPSPVSASSFTASLPPWHEPTYPDHQHSPAHLAAANTDFYDRTTVGQSPESLPYDDQEGEKSDPDQADTLPLKGKRRRASTKQLEVLNRVFERTFFPSTQLRTELGRQLGMSPRTVQIWFQNRRQAIRTRDRQRRPHPHNQSSRASSLSS